MMLGAEALVHMLHLCDKGILRLPDTLLRDRLPVVLIQMANRTLLTQADTGSWNASVSPEATAYGVLTLKALSPLPWVVSISKQVDSAIQAGQQRLAQTKDDWNNPEHLWIEKITYGSRRLAEAYCLAAMQPSISRYVWSEQIYELMQFSEKLVSRTSTIISSIKPYQDQPIWKLDASVIEGKAFLPQLKSTRREVLPGQKNAKNEYLDLIPYTWVLVNNHKGLFLPASLLWDMMVITIGNFRVDEYMESVVAKISQDNREQIRQVISALCSYEETDSSQPSTICQQNSAVVSDTRDKIMKFSAVANTWDNIGPEAAIKCYVGAMIDYPQIQSASLTDKKYLRSQLRDFLHSHIDQIEDNARFTLEGPGPPSGIAILTPPRTSYHTWAHTVGASSVSCPFSFAFLSCILGANTSLITKPRDCFQTIFEKYVARDLCGHLSVMSRIYNDYGSFERDQLESNINSVNFPEFHYSHNVSHGQVEREIDITEWKTQLKADLLALAQYDREGVAWVGSKLLNSLRSTGVYRDRTKADGVELFIGVTELYADLYVKKDLSNHIETRKCLAS